MYSGSLRFPSPEEIWRCEWPSRNSWINSGDRGVSCERKEKKLGRNYCSTRIYVVVHRVVFFVNTFMLFSKYDQCRISTKEIVCLYIGTPIPLPKKWGILWYLSPPRSYGTQRRIYDHFFVSVVSICTTVTEKSQSPSPSHPHTLQLLLHWEVW